MKRARQDLAARAFSLAQRMFKLYSELAATSRAHAHLADQLFRAITSIGAHIEEGQAPGSRKDMAFKYAVALRESREANYWSRLGATDPKWTDKLEFITRETGEFIAMLTVSVRKLRVPAEPDEPDENLEG